MQKKFTIIISATICTSSDAQYYSTVSVVVVTTVAVVGLEALEAAVGDEVKLVALRLLLRALDVVLAVELLVLILVVAAVVVYG